MLFIIRFPVIERHYYFWISPCCEWGVDEIVTVAFFFFFLPCIDSSPGSCLETVDNERPMVFSESDTSFHCFPTSSFRADEGHVDSSWESLSSPGWSVKFTGVWGPPFAKPTGFMHLEGLKEDAEWSFCKIPWTVHSSWWRPWTVPDKSVVWPVLDAVLGVRRLTICL